MTRAMETSDIILKYFPDLPTDSDDMLREGSPIPPEPPSGSWRPEYKASIETYLFFNFIRFKKALQNYICL